VRDDVGDGEPQAYGLGALPEYAAAYPRAAARSARDTGWRVRVDPRSRVPVLASRLGWLGSLIVSAIITVVLLLVRATPGSARG